MKKTFIYIFVVLLSGCRCGGLIEDANGTKGELPTPDVTKRFYIINHTKNRYSNNALYSLCPFKEKNTGKWKMRYFGEKRYVKVEKIEPHQKIDKSNKKKLILREAYCYQDEYDNSIIEATGEYYLFLFSLNNGSRKIFFGAYSYAYKGVYEDEPREDCYQYFVKWELHPIFQNKETIIHIYKDGVKIDNLKKITKLKNKGKELDIDLNNIPIVGSDFR